jgi:hypothetical protein
VPAHRSNFDDWHCVCVPTSPLVKLSSKSNYGTASTPWTEPTLPSEEFFTFFERFPLPKSYYEQAAVCN